MPCRRPTQHQFCLRLDRFKLIVDTTYYQRSDRHTVRAEALALGDLTHEVRLLLLEIRRESLFLRLLQSLLDVLALLGSLSFGLLLHSACQSSIVALQCFPEFGVGLSLVVKIHGVGCATRADVRE